MPDLKALADLLERHDKEMTPGKWQFAIVSPDSLSIGPHEPVGLNICGSGPRYVSWNRGEVLCAADAAGIAYLRNALPALIAALERAERMREAGNRLVRELESWHEINELQPDADMEAIAAWYAAIKESPDA